MLNLVYHDMQDERVYQVISRRLKDKFDIFGGLPDTIEDEWIESVERLETMMDQFHPPPPEGSRRLRVPVQGDN